MKQILLRENKMDRTKEHFWVVCLSTANKILLIELVSLGTMRESLIDPTEVFSFALQKRAAQLIMVHNHPGGTLTPSPQDLHVTDRMYHVGEIVKLPVIDHLIITEKGYMSFVDKRLFEEIAKSTRFVPKYMQEEKRLRAEGELKKAIEMARALKKDGVKANLIAKASGLSIKEIQKL